jgi:hypothetical protein
MQTYKRLGWVVKKGYEIGTWEVKNGGGGVVHKASGNKGQVMMEALRISKEAGNVELVGGKWRLLND